MVSGKDAIDRFIRSKISSRMTLLKIGTKRQYLQVPWRNYIKCLKTKDRRLTESDVHTELVELQTEWVTLIHKRSEELCEKIIHFKPFRTFFSQIDRQRLLFQNLKFHTHDYTEMQQQANKFWKTLFSWIFINFEMLCKFQH